MFLKVYLIKKVMLQVSVEVVDVNLMLKLFESLVLKELKETYLVKLPVVMEYIKEHLLQLNKRKLKNME